MLSLLPVILVILACRPVLAVPQAASSVSVTTTTTSSVTSSVSTTASPSSTSVSTSTATSSVFSTASSVTTVSSSASSSSASSSSSSVSSSISSSISSVSSSISSSISSASSSMSTASANATSSASTTSSSATSSVAPPPTPAGGLGTSPTETPQYVPMSDYDVQSLNLALLQEYLELDLFHNGLARFSSQDFDSAGINADQQFLIEYMADQEVGHAELISNILGTNASKPCTYGYPFGNVRDFIDFSVKITTIGESGVLGFLSHLDSRAAASLLSESITVESRQEMVLRQMEGLFPMPQFFNPAISQSMQWTQISPWLLTCPAENIHVGWQNFPGLNITNAANASAISNDTLSAVSHNRSTPLSTPGQLIHLQWEAPGKAVGPNASYITTSAAGTPAFAAWISQLNVTYTPLINVTNFTAFTQQPGGAVFANGTTGLVNGTVFVVVTDANPVITSFNGSLLDQHVVAGPAAYTAG